MPANLLIFDDGAGQFGPLTDMRAVFDIRSGALTTRQRIETLLGQQARAIVVPQVLAAICSSADANRRTLVNPQAKDLEPVAWLMVNGRCSAAHNLDSQLRELPIGHALVQRDGQLIAAHLPQQQILEAQKWRLPEDVTVERLEQRALIERPWHLLDEIDATLTADLLAMIQIHLETQDTEQDQKHDPNPVEQPSRPRPDVIGDQPIKIADDVDFISPSHTLLLAEKGPIIVEAGVQIGAMTVLEGPCYVGRNTVIAHHSSIRPNTVIGPECKAAGEISCSIIHGQTNKAHHGYLGHSLVGQWVNLGAATNVSNLKNTYGEVRVQLEADRANEASGRTFQGPIIGDFVRTGIGSRLLTGSCIGTGAMVAMGSYPPKFIDRFMFMTDNGADPYDMGKLLDTITKMMARRGQQLHAAIEARLRELANVDGQTDVSRLRYRAG